MIHSKKTNPDEQGILEANIKIFSKALVTMYEIGNLLKQLESYGERNYKDYIKKLRINKDTLLEDLTLICKEK